MEINIKSGVKFESGESDSLTFNLVYGGVMCGIGSYGGYKIAEQCGSPTSSGAITGGLITTAFGALIFLFDYITRNKREYALGLAEHARIEHSLMDSYISAIEGLKRLEAKA